MRPPRPPSRQGGAEGFWGVSTLLVPLFTASHPSPHRGSPPSPPEPLSQHQFRTSATSPRHLSQEQRGSLGSRDSPLGGCGSGTPPTSSGPTAQELGDGDGASGGVALPPS